MARPLLELVSTACREIGVTVPTQLYGSTDDQAQQLLALANREGKEFSQLANKNGGWQALHEEYLFTTASLPATTGNITDGSAVITNIPSTVGIVAGTWTVTANGIPYQARVVSVDSATQVTVNMASTATATGVSLQFGQAAYELPSDLEYFIAQTEWDSSFRWQLLGPLTAQEKNVLRYGISPVGPRRRFWIEDNLMWIDPTPAESGDIIAYDYYTENWCKSASGTPQSLWMADTDTYRLDEECFIHGMKFRFLRAKGLDYTQEYADYQMACNRVLGRDGTARSLPINSRGTKLRLLNNDNVPDTGFGQ